ncbi:unnamed protein product, partial [Prorocentrum cordatum]
MRSCPPPVAAVLCTVWAAAGGGATVPDDGASAAEDFVRRACKFRPLPRDLGDGHGGADGSYRVSDVFSLPLSALARGGHNVTATVQPGSWLGLTAQ